MFLSTDFLTQLETLTEWLLTDGLSRKGARDAIASKNMRYVKNKKKKRNLVDEVAHL